MALGDPQDVGVVVKTRVPAQALPDQLPIHRWIGLVIRGGFPFILQNGLKSPCRSKPPTRVIGFLILERKQKNKTLRGFPTPATPEIPPNGTPD